MKSEAEISQILKRVKEVHDQAFKAQQIAHDMHQQLWQVPENLRKISAESYRQAHEEKMRRMLAGLREELTRQMLMNSIGLVDEL